MVSESIIDKVIEQLQSQDIYQEKLKSLVEHQHAIVSFFESEGFEILSNDERDLLWYLTVVVYESIKSQSEHQDFISIKKIESAEEHNYSLLKHDHMKFSEIADLYFDNYPQEDLLALIEDTVIPDQEDFPSPVGRKVIFITMKTIIDVLTSPN